MSEIVFYRFQPDAMDKEMLERLFTGRNRRNLLTKLTNEIKSAVKNRTPRYYLIIGPRGVGKTHFISLLYHDVMAGIENVLPIKLSEEEYSIYRVSDLLLRMLGMTGERERINFGEFERMSDDEVVVAALEELKSKGKTIVLFLENLNQILGEQMSKKEVQRLRSIFQTENIFTVVTSAPLVFPQVSEHQEPFFNFFDIIYLKELTRDELKELVREIAEIENNEEFLSKMDEYAQKIDAVGVLTGGSPRMAILLYELMSKGKIVDVEKAFFKLLDENTPYYQDVFRLLSSQKRKVFDTLISIGKPTTPKEIAKRARLDDKTVNTQLRRLEKDGYVISRRMGKTTKYEVRERLFRLWRELRRQPFAMQKLSILVEFLELWYSLEERKEKFLEYLREASDETRAREASYWFLSLPKDYKRELIPRVVKEAYEPEKAKLLDELIYGDRELKAEAEKAECLVLLEKGNYEELLKKAEEMIKVEKNNAFAWFTKGRAMMNLNKHEEALDAFSKSTELNPKSDYGWFFKGLILGILGRNKEAVQALSKAIELNPKNALSWSLTGSALAHLERHEEAVQALSKSLELNPEDADAWRSKGSALEMLRRHKEALEALLKAIDLNPEDTLAWYEKGEVLASLGRFDEALEASTKAIDLNPENAVVWLEKGAILSRLGRPEEALEAFSKAIALNPKFDEAWIGKGIVLGMLERPEEALDASSNAITLNPENAEAWIGKGVVLGMLERPEEALDAFSKAIALNPKFDEAWIGKGLALKKIDKPEEALEALSKAITLNPKCAEAWYFKEQAHLAISLQEFKRNNYGNALENLTSAMDAFDNFSGFLKDREKGKEARNDDIMTFLKELIAAKNVEAVDMALNAIFEKKEELKELLEPIYVAVEIVKSKDVSKYYELQVERREVVAEIVKRLTGSEELLPE